MSLPILIGGAPRSGKSTLAKNLSEQLNSPWISTDEMRKRFRLEKQNEKAKYPWIFSTAGATAEEFWKTRTPQDVLRVEVEEARELWPTLKSEMASGRQGIIEGVSILPQLLWEDFGNTIKAVFLVDPDRERVRRIINQYGLWSNTTPYPDWIKPLELEVVMLYNGWLRQEIAKYPYPIIEANQQDEMTRIKEVLDK